MTDKSIKFASTVQMTGTGTTYAVEFEVQYACVTELSHERSANESGPSAVNSDILAVVRSMVFEHARSDLSIWDIWFVDEPEVNNRLEYD